MKMHQNLMPWTPHCQERGKKRQFDGADTRVIDKYGERYNVAKRRKIVILSGRRARVVARCLKRWLKGHLSPQFQKRAKRVRRLIARLEKLADWMMVVSPRGDIITAYRASKQAQKKLMWDALRALQGLCFNTEKNR